MASSRPLVTVAATTTDGKLWREPRYIFVQDIPRDVAGVDEIPDDWRPAALPFGHAEVVDAVRTLVAEVDATDPEWLHVALPGADIEVSVTAERRLTSFALHVRATDHHVADAFVAQLLQQLGVRAFEPASDTGIFEG